MEVDGEEELGRREGDRWRWEGEGQAEEELKRLHLCSRRVYYYQQEGKNCLGMLWVPHHVSLIIWRRCEL